MARLPRIGRLALVATLLAAGTAGVMAHVPLTDGVGNTLRWANPGNIGIVINSTGSDDLPDGSHETALRNAIAEWNGATGTTVSLVEDQSANQQARTDWPQSNIHLILFDEANNSGFFPGSSGIVAITPVAFISGTIVDADVLFNGGEFSFTTSGDPMRFDVADVGTHELGHLIGLDHSGWAGATMYPFVDRTVILHRSVSSDDVTGLRVSYPMGSHGSITGVVERAADSSPVLGANVVARGSDGRPAASILTRAGGAFTIGGLDPDTYTVYAVPLGDGSGSGSDAPVDASNLGSFFAIQTDFQAGVYGMPAVVVGSGNVDLGTLQVGADTPLNLGTEFDRFPIHAPSGTTTPVLIQGANLSGAGTTLSASDPDVVLSSVVFGGNQVTFDVTVPGGEPAGHVDLAVTLVGGETTILPAALEITPPNPTVASVAPASGSVLGGTALTLTGTNFNPGARIVIGDQIYVDGVGGTAVAGPTQITLTTNTTVSGTHDVVVIDPSGVEGRSVGGFSALALPTITSVFPNAGSTSGGTTVTITGTNLQNGGTVTIDGQDQGPITYVSETKWTFESTANGTAGSKILTVTNPSMAQAASAFTYVSGSDPSISMLAPSSGRAAGGETITLTGMNLTAQSEVLFGADPETGTGGATAPSVTFVDANTLQVVTPGFVSGALYGNLDVMVRDALTQQVGLAPGAFSVAAPGGGGGGGSCHMVPVSGPPTVRDVVVGFGWGLAALALLVQRARRARGQRRLAHVRA